VRVVFLGWFLDWRVGWLGQVRSHFTDCVFGSLVVRWLLSLFVPPPPPNSLDTLHKILKNKLLIESNTILPFTTPLSTSNPPTLDTYLKQLTKQGYLESIKIGGHSNATRNVDGGVVVDVEWRWGGRADAEIGERAVAEFMADL
jgi:hypothetical protein